MTCSICNREIVQPNKGRLKVFCSRDCAVHAASIRRAKWTEHKHHCVYCMNQFQSSRAHAQYCSDSCRKAHKRNAMPRDLTSIHRWVLWRYEARGEGRTKVPYQINGLKASSTGRSTWTSYACCRKRFALGGFDGIGFVLHESDDIYCVDLDDCLVDGVPNDNARRFLDSVGETYIEISPSGKGLHIFLRGNCSSRVNRSLGYEIYSSGRYICMTGKHWMNKPIARIDDCELPL